METAAELQELNALGAKNQTPVTDTSFGAAFDRSFDLAVESDWSISGYIANGPIRDRNDRLAQMIKDGEVDPALVERSRINNGQMRNRIDFDAIAEQLNADAGIDLFLTKKNWSDFRAEQHAKEQELFAADMASGDKLTMAGTFSGALVAGAADPGMLAAGVLTAGAAPLVGAGANTIRAAKATTNGAEALADILEAAETVKTVTRWQRALQLARPAAVEGMLSEGGLMLANAQNRRDLNMDYTPAEILAGLGFGAALGGGLGGAVGGLGAKSYNNMLKIRQEQAAEMIDQLVLDGKKAADIIGEILTGVRDRRGRLVKQDLPEKALDVPETMNTAPWIGDVTWVTNPANEEAFIRAVKQRLSEPTETGMRTQHPPASRKEAKATLPLGVYIDGAYRGLSGRGIARLLRGEAGWNTADFDAGEKAFTVFSSPDRANKVDSGGFIVRFNPDAMVGRMVYRKSDIGKQWEKGDVTFKVMNDSKYQPEGRGDNFVADAIDEIRVIDEIAFKRGSAEMKKLRKQLRKAGFEQTREDGVTVFRRRDPGPPPTRQDLINSREALEGAVQRLLDSKDFMSMAPPGVEGLPASYIADRIQGAARHWTGVDLRPVAAGRSVADFEAATGAKLGDDVNTSGVLSEAEQAEIDVRFAELVESDPDMETVLIEDNAEITDKVTTVRLQTVVDKQAAELDKLKAALTTCTTGA